MFCKRLILIMIVGGLVALGAVVCAADVSPMQGAARPLYMDRLKRLLAECDRRGMVVDVTLNRREGSIEGGGLSNAESHLRAVEVLVETLKPYRNWYLDLANERDVGDARFVSCEELKRLREVVRNLDPGRLVTASFGGHDLSENDLQDMLVKVGVDFVCPHRPRRAGSPRQTEPQTRKALEMMKAKASALSGTVSQRLRELGSWRRGFSDGFTGRDCGRSGRVVFPQWEPTGRAGGATTTVV